MGHDWIVDVLADLKRYAQRHRLDDLNASLGNAILVAEQSAPYAGERLGGHVPRADDIGQRIAERTGESR